MLITYLYVQQTLCWDVTSGITNCQIRKKKNQTSKIKNMTAAQGQRKSKEIKCCDNPKFSLFSGCTSVKQMPFAGNLHLPAAHFYLRGKVGATEQKLCTQKFTQVKRNCPPPSGQAQTSSMEFSSVKIPDCHAAPEANKNWLRASVSC